MKRSLFFLFLLLPLSIFSQNKVSLLPENMVKYIGKVDRSAFEEVVGSPLDEEEGGIIVYEVENSYDNEITALRCFYDETTGKLISARFGTSHYLGIWIGMSSFEGYDEKKNCVVTKEDGVTKKIEFKINGFGCQILNITRIAPQVETAEINYHTVKK